MGTIITLIEFHSPLPPLPYSVLYIFQNIPHLIIFLRIIYANRKRMKELNTVGNEHLAVKTVMGKNIAVVINADEYFKGLQQQWK
uniref:Uncharacterized protein n=1 Tax=Panagrolaimus davidi TaxID=227884 RepID=A0A914R123_9BILA